MIVKAWAFSNVTGLVLCGVVQSLNDCWDTLTCFAISFFVLPLLFITLINDSRMTADFFNSLNTSISYSHVYQYEQFFCTIHLKNQTKAVSSNSRSSSFWTSSTKRSSWTSVAHLMMCTSLGLASSTMFIFIVVSFGVSPFFVESFDFRYFMGKNFC